MSDFGRQLVFPVAEDVRVQCVFTGDKPVTRAAIDKLIALLEITRDAFPETEGSDRGALGEGES